jgi:hypothetical protein
MPGNSILGWVTKDWIIGAVMRYGSGFPIMAPLAQNGLNSILFRGSGPGNAGGTFANLVPGQPFFTQDLNCRCFDPQKDFVLNPKAWSDPAAGTFGTSAAYYTNYRQARRPSESMSFGRIFQFKEGRYKLQIRAEFVNIFNRTYLNTPTTNNALSNQQRNAAGMPSAGFGFINTASVQTAPRQGTLVGRFTF